MQHIQPMHACILQFNVVNGQYAALDQYVTPSKCANRLLRPALVIACSLNRSPQDRPNHWPGLSNLLLFCSKLTEAKGPAC